MHIAKTLTTMMLALIFVAGCSTLGDLPTTLFGEKMLLSIEATGPKPVAKKNLGAVPVPLGGVLTAQLLRSYGAEYLSETAELDKCKLASAHEPPDPEPDALGVITVSGTVICRLPDKSSVREVVTFTLTPIEEK